MDNQPKETYKEPYKKSRSASGSITEGFRLYAKSLKMVVRSSWPIALLYALACSALMTLQSDYLPQLQAIAVTGRNAEALAGDLMPLTVALVAIILVGGLLEIGVYASAISLLREHAATGQMTTPQKWYRPALSAYVRTLCGLVLCILAAMAIAAILAAVVLLPLHFMPSAGEGSLTQTIAMVAIAIIATLASLPLCVTFFGYAYSNDGFLTQLKRGYSLGTRRYGYVFIVMLATLIVIGLAEFILSLPAAVLGMANFQASLGLVYGDPLGMPSYVTPVSAVVFFIAGFVQVYIRLSAIFTGTYMHGSLEAQESERKSYKELSLNADKQ